MVIVIELKTGKSVLLDVKDYSFDGATLSYIDSAGKHYVPFAAIRSWSFGTEQRKKEYAYNEVHGE